MKYSQSTGTINVNAGKNGNFDKFIYSGNKSKRKIKKVNK